MRRYRRFATAIGSRSGEARAHMFLFALESDPLAELRDAMSSDPHPVDGAYELLNAVKVDEAIEHRARCSRRTLLA
jgi:hypothetical protein